MDLSLEKFEEERKGTLLAPEGILMMSLAVMLDLGGLVGFIPKIGQILSYIPDILGLILIGGWMLFRSQTLTVTQRAAMGIGKAAKWAKRLKWLRPLFFIGEFIPFVGILSLWVLVVWFELKI